MGREGRDYWEAQLSEYWDSGLTIQEYSELKELPYEVCAQRAPWGGGRGIFLSGNLPKR